MMLSKRTVKYLLLSTGFVLLYVHQQTAILRVSYAIEKKERKLAELSEHYKLAKYQVARLRSPNFLNQQLKTHSFNLTSPKVIEVVKVPMPKVEATAPHSQNPASTTQYLERLAPGTAPQSVWPAKPSLISWVSSIKEAQAKTLSK